MPSARGVYVPRVNHLSVVSRPLALTDTTAIDCDLYQKVTRRYTTAVFWPSALTGTAGHLLTSAVSRPMGLTNTTKVFRCKQKLFSQQSTISRFTISRDHNE